MKLTVVPEQIVPEGDAAIETAAVPDVALVCVNTAQFFDVVNPFAVPETDEARTLPEEDEVLVA